jgi:hypothetical protein
MTDDTVRFTFSYGSLRPLLSLMGLGPRWSRVEIGPGGLEVRMGWGFRARIARPTIRRADLHDPIRSAIGVHGWKGRWLVNGASTGIVLVDIDPPARGYVTGYPVRLRQLLLSLEDPSGFVATFR